MLNKWVDKPIVPDITFEAAAAMNTTPTLPFRFVELDANGRVAICNAATDLVIGVVQNANNITALGREAQVRVYGVSFIVTGAAVTMGARVGTDTTGRAVVKASDADLVAGIALQTSDGAGEIIPILLTPAAQRAA